jgi:hypothetical protein
MRGTEKDRPADRIRSIRVDDKKLTLRLFDGRTLLVPLSFYPALRDAAPADRANCRIFGYGYAIEWPTLDYHLGAEGLIEGRREGAWYPAWRKKHPIGSAPVFNDDFAESTSKRQVRRKSAARKASVTRRATRR